MPDDPQPAARADDAVQHSQARLGRGLGALGGAALALGVLFLAGALEIGTMGLATPVVIGVGALAVGGIGAAMSAGSNLGADEGRKFVHDDGQIASGLATILVGPDRKPLAHVYSNANCNDHKHLSGGPGPCSDVVNAAQEQIAEGSGTVLIGPGLLPAARVGSQGTCEFTVGHGSPTVIIGGPTLRLLKVGNGDDPDKGFFDGVGTVSGYIGIAGAALVLWPATLSLGGVALMGAGGAGAWLVGKAVGKGMEYLPEGEVRDAAGLALAVLPLAGLPKMARGLSRTEGLGRAKGESEEGFTSRVQSAKNARLEAEWRARVQASKPRAGELPLGPDGRPIPAFARAAGAARAAFDDGRGVFSPKRDANVLEARRTGGGGGSASSDFTGRLRGQDVTLPGVKTEPLTYTKRAEADAAALRRQFNGKARFLGTRNNPGPVIENRANFLKDLANDSTKEASLRAAGIDDAGLARMRQGNVPDPDVWQVHHKLPLDDGGTNAPDNLVLMRNEPYHKVITNAQDTMTGNLSPGETAQLPNWPVPDGSVYPPQWPIPSAWPAPPPPP